VPKLSLEEILCPEGVLNRRLPGYEYRPSQLAMANAVWQAIENYEHLCVEAGTGTGKTLAYLIPSLGGRKRVVISTATINLQEQLLNQDIPFIRKHLIPGLRTTYMKGRNNYLCRKRFQEAQNQRRILEDELDRHFELLGAWSKQTSTGDRSELEWLEDNDPLWHRIDARRDICIGQKCEYFSECWITRMRQRALGADVIVVNHALLFANLALESDEIGRVFPEFSILILDEAHAVEEIAADYFGRRISNYQVEDFLRQFKVTFSTATQFSETLRKIERTAGAFFAGFPGKDGRYSLIFFRGQNQAQIDLREELSQEYQEFDSALRLLYHQVEQESEQPPEASVLTRRLDEFLVTLEEIFQKDHSDNVYWFERSGRGVFLSLTPINIAKILRDRLFERTDTVVLTSGTLKTNGNFEYIKERLGIPEPLEVAVPGEFNYSEQAILYVPKRTPEPRTEEYFNCALEEIRRILSLTEGHAFLLFTSFLQMSRVYEALREEGRYPLFTQGEMPKTKLLELFKSTPGAVLCGTSSFWQGVDVRGDALRAVVIDKLPFQVPTEPLVAARAEKLRQEGRDPFQDYMIPAAIIALKQGLGRLIRSRRDWGILAILDSRLWSRQYGQAFFNSLPNCSVTDNIEDLKNFLRRNVSKPVEGFDLDG
jgi:ATP-dependent DNA helicase DinG